MGLTPKGVAKSRKEAPQFIYLQVTSHPCEIATEGGLDVNFDIWAFWLLRSINKKRFVINGRFLFVFLCALVSTETNGYTCHTP